MRLTKVHVNANGCSNALFSPQLLRVIIAHCAANNKSKLRSLSCYYAFLFPMLTTYDSNDCMSRERSCIGQTMCVFMSRERESERDKSARDGHNVHARESFAVRRLISRRVTRGTRSRKLASVPRGHSLSPSLSPLMNGRTHDTNAHKHAQRFECLNSSSMAAAASYAPNARLHQFPGQAR